MLKFNIGIYIEKNLNFNNRLLQFKNLLNLVF